jgi:hypothetical protein
MNDRDDDGIEPSICPPEFNDDTQVEQVMNRRAQIAAFLVILYGVYQIQISLSSLLSPLPLITNLGYDAPQSAPDLERREVSTVKKSELLIPMVSSDSIPNGATIETPREHDMQSKPASGPDENTLDNADNRVSLSVPSKILDHAHAKSSDKEPPEDSIAVTTNQSQRARCQDYDGVLFMSNVDRNAATGTAFFHYVVDHLIYANMYNLLPVIQIDQINPLYDPAVHGLGSNRTVQVRKGEISTITGTDGMRCQPRKRNRGIGYPGKPILDNPILRNLTLHGNGIWDSYFEPPVPSFSWDDPSCLEMTFLEMSHRQVHPGMHVCWPLAVRGWMYTGMPYDLHENNKTLQEWFRPMRERGSRMTSQYIRLKPWLKELVDQANPPTKNCLAMHIRQTDKGHGRRKVPLAVFRVYAEAYSRSSGSGSIFIATDSANVFHEIQEQWDKNVTSRILTQAGAFRSSTDKSTFKLLANQTHRVNTEALVDIYAMSRCSILVHGLSAMSEGAIYLNPRLHDHSVNLDDGDPTSIEEFRVMVERVLSGKRELSSVTNKNENTTPSMSNEDGQASRTKPNFELRKTSRVSRNESEVASIPRCEDYDGVLYISAVGKSAATGTAFFNFVVDQLIYADKYDLLPWIYIDDQNPLFDPIAHGIGANRSFHVKKGAVPSIVGSDTMACKNNRKTGTYPGPPDFDSLEPFRYTIKGNGIWASYFHPVSSFSLDDPTCMEKPFIRFDFSHIFPGLHKCWPWSVRSWNFRGLPIALSPHNSTVHDWLGPMRERGSKMVSKYFRLLPWVDELVEKANPSTSQCLAMHVRLTDKGHGRRKLSLDAFKPYAEAYVKASGSGPIFVATDSAYVLAGISEQWGPHVRPRVRSQIEAFRSTSNTATFVLLANQTHRVNTEALVDIYAMARCNVFVHGFSAMAEAVIYLRPQLHAQSVNLDEETHASVEEFQAMVEKVIASAGNSVIN